MRSTWAPPSFLRDSTNGALRHLFFFHGLKALHSPDVLYDGAFFEAVTATSLWLARYQARPSSSRWLAMGRKYVDSQCCRHASLTRPFVLSGLYGPEYWAVVFILPCCNQTRVELDISDTLAEETVQSKKKKRTTECVACIARNGQRVRCAKLASVSS